MKKTLVVLLAVSICLAVVWAGDVKVIPADSEHVGDIKIEKGNLEIGKNADLAGNIFIEEGDLFIADNVDIVGAVTIKKGNIL